MAQIKLAIIYYSATGANYQMAQWAEEAGKEAGAEVKVLKVSELAPESAINNNPAWKAYVERSKDVPTASVDDLDWADAIVFSVPTRYGNMASQMKQFIDQTGGLWAQGKLANKAVTAMSSAMNPHGGQEATVLSLYTTLMHWGAIIVPPGYTDAAVFASGGNPYGTTATVAQDGTIKDDVRAGVLHQVKRTITVAGWIKQGMGK